MKAEAAEWRAKLIEEVAATDDALMEKFFEDPDSITAEELLAAIRKATISMQIVPMLCGSSFHNKGVQKLLDYVDGVPAFAAGYARSDGYQPQDRARKRSRHASENDPFCGLAFKIATDPFVGRLAFVRVYSGKLDAGSYVLNTRSGKQRAYQPHLPDARQQAEPDGDRRRRRHLRCRRFQGDPHGRYALRRERTDRARVR